MPIEQTSYAELGAMYFAVARLGRTFNPIADRIPQPNALKHNEAEMAALDRRHSRAERVCMLLRASVSQSRAWNWTEAGVRLNEAYEIAGLQPPIADSRDAGEALHRGEHPIQQTDDQEG